MIGVGSASGVPSMVDKLEVGGKVYKTAIKLPMLCRSGRWAIKNDR